jgi:2,3-bisphosphoglycerate-dependent phosphoglycerate mutase
MKKYITLLSLLFISLFNVTPINAQEKNERTTSVYFIRHAEKDRSNPDERNPHLTDQGIQRAEKWAHFFKDIPLDAVYSTNYHRTIETAYPTAQQKGLEVINYDPRILDPAPFVNKHKGRTILIVGHSNTTPAFVNAFLGEKKYEDLSDTDNGSVFLVRYSDLEKNAVQYHVD